MDALSRSCVYVSCVYIRVEHSIRTNKRIVQTTEDGHLDLCRSNRPTSFKQRRCNNRHGPTRPNRTASPRSCSSTLARDLVGGSAVLSCPIRKRRKMRRQRKETAPTSTGKGYCWPKNDKLTIDDLNQECVLQDRCEVA